MSIENTLERIAAALETIAKNGGQLPAQEAPKSPATVVPPAAAAPAPSNTAAPAPSKPLPSAAVPASPVATAVVAVPPANPSMTLVELNSALVAEYVRLGNDRAPIDAAFKQFNVSSAAGLTPDQYAPMLAAVRAITK